MAWVHPTALQRWTRTELFCFKETIETASFETLSDLADKAPDAKYIIPFLNVYAAPNNASHLIVDVNGGYHEAVPSDQLTTEDKIFDFKSCR